MAKRSLCFLLAGVAFAATAATASSNVYGQCLLNWLNPAPPVQVTNYAPGCDTCNPCTTCARPVVANYAYTPTSYRYGWRRPFNGFFARLFGWERPYTAGYAPYTAGYAPYTTVGYAGYGSTGCSTCASPCTTCASPAPACGNCGSCSACSGAASMAPSLTSSGYAAPIGTGVPASSGSCPTCASGVSYESGSPAAPQFNLPQITPGPATTTPADIPPAISPTEMTPIESGVKRNTLKKGADVSDLFTRKSPATLTPLESRPAEPKFVPPPIDTTARASSGWATHATHRPAFTPEVKPAPEMPAGIRPVVDLDAPAMPSKAPEAKKAPVLFNPFDRTAKAPQRDIIPAVYSHSKGGEIAPVSRTTPVTSRKPVAKSRIRTADDDGKVWDDSGWN